MAYSTTLDTANNLVSLDEAKFSAGLDLSLAQELDILCLAENGGGGIAGEYFLFSTTVDDYYVWYDVGADPTDPAVANRTGIEVDISDGDSATEVAVATTAKITAVTGVTATSVGNTIHITNDTAGAVTTPTEGTSPFTVTIDIKGSAGDTKSDGIITDLINAVSCAFKKRTRRQLKTASLTEYYDGPGGTVLYLKNYPASGLSIYQDSGRAWAASSEITASNLSLYEDEGKIKLHSDVFGTDAYSIKAVYTGGYSTIPYDLRQAAMFSVIQSFENMDHHALSTQSRSNDKGGSTRYRVELLPEVKETLEDYMKKTGFF